jgi:hypothetical protein
MNREDKPRKAGGGHNNIGNLKDLIEAEKYDYDETEYEVRYGKRTEEKLDESTGDKPTLN